MDALVFITLRDALGIDDPGQLPPDHIAASMGPVAAMLECSPDDAAVFLLTGRHPRQWDQDWRNDMTEAIALSRRAGAEHPDRAAGLLQLLKMGQASLASIVAQSFLAADARR